jgi:hypothetical protein
MESDKNQYIIIKNEAFFMFVVTEFSSINLTLGKCTGPTVRSVVESSMDIPLAVKRRTYF